MGARLIIPVRKWFPSLFPVSPLFIALPSSTRRLNPLCSYILYFILIFVDIERDIVDRIMANLINPNRNRRQVIKKMKEMGLITSAKELAKTKQSVRIRPPKEWADHELVELRRIFEEVRHSSGFLILCVLRLTCSYGILLDTIEETIEIYNNFSSPAPFLI